VPVLHAIMAEIVQIMDHHFHAHVRLDIVVTAAKSKVNILFSKTYTRRIFFYFSIFIPDGILLNRGEAVVKFKRGALAPC
jgi:hypothetical protein